MRAVDVVHHERRRRRGRGLSGAATAAAWTVYVYLWLPAITLLAWTLGVRTAWAETVLERSRVDVAEVATMVGLVVALGCALVLWAEQQRRRFTGVERRGRAADVTAPQAGGSLGVDDVVVDGLQGARVAVVHLDADGRPVRVDAAVAGGRPRVPAPRRPADERAGVVRAR